MWGTLVLLALAWQPALPDRSGHRAAGSTASVDVEADSSHTTTVHPVRLDARGHPHPRQHHFRRHGQAPWHGRTSYKIHAFNNTWLLQLKPHLHFLAPQLHVASVGEDNSSLTVLLAPEKWCYYEGRIVGDSPSRVSVSLCQGMTGHIHSSSYGDFLVEPLPEESSSDTSDRPHRLSRLRRSSESKTPVERREKTFCDVQESFVQMKHSKRKDNENTTVVDIISSFPIVPHPLPRKRRSVSRELHLEVLVVADNKMARYHGDNLRHYILTLMSTVALIYKDPSIGNNINIAVVKVVIMNEHEDRDVIHSSAPVTLRKFCSWQQRINHNDDRHPYHHDTAILITREDLCRFPRACDTLGLAQSGMVCDSLSSCAIVEDNGLSAAFTIAHELGHVMSIPHDDDRKCSRYQDEKQKLHVMARMLDYNSHPWSWSSCSRQYLTTFLDVGYGGCLRDKPTENLLKHDEEFQRLPGQLYPRDRQCQLVFGPKSRICTYMPVCKRLWCTMEDTTQGGCRTQHMPWADGTQCGTDKWCHQGDCTRGRPAGVAPTDGQWGEWKEFGSCSRSCGGGIQQALRECDYPRPSNGGRYCVGRRVKYRSCNTEECPPGEQDFRNEQCAVFNGHSFGFPGLPSSVHWVPYYGGISPNDKCKLYCKSSETASYFMLKEKVIDGTPCGPGTFDLCVNGVCLSAGCDHRLDSDKKLDICGVCGGNNSTCKFVSGYFDKVEYGYHNIVMIPPGASNIDIWQYGHDNTKDDNYLALKDDNNGYILNGKFMISMFPKTFQYFGITIDYSGSDSVVEHVNSTKPLKKDLFVQVLTVGKLQPPKIKYQYTVPLSDNELYSWHLATEWSECSRICEGERYLRPICRRKADLLPVSDGHCSETEQPTQKAQACNLHCSLKWRIVHRSECSVQCGRGIRKRVVKCMQELESKESNGVPDEFCTHLGPKPDIHEKCRGSCLNAHWEFTDWSKCTVTCGGGLQERSATCKNSNDDIQPDSHCDPAQKLTSKPCNTGSCPYWELGEWTECSVTCGVGERQRPYWCQHSDKKIHGIYCEPQPVPEHKEICNLPPCVHWEAEEWEPCSVTCGEGNSYRSIHCVTSSGEVTEERFCSHITQPIVSRSCSLSHCPFSSAQTDKAKNNGLIAMPLIQNRTWTPRVHSSQDINAISTRVTTGFWQAGEWSECSAACGEGLRNRSITCHDEESVLPSFFCDHSSKPTNVEICEIRPCGQWKVGEWTECSLICGGGLQRRQVACYGEDGQPSELCDSTEKPSEKAPCNTGPCPDWSVGPWSECSVTCGEGIERRTLMCVDDEGHTVHNDKCILPQPATTRKCLTVDCPYWEWSEWSQCSVTCGNGTQSRQPYCSYEGTHDVVVCGPLPEPERRSCYIEADCGFRWRKSSWSLCNVTCGHGYKNREIVCVGRKNRRVSPEYCYHKRKPKMQKKCKLKQCPMVWQVGQWSECSQTCGKGMQFRSVSCHSVNEYGWADPEPVSQSSNLEHWCDTTHRPAKEKICNFGHCDEGYLWRPGEWLLCTGKCGKEKQKRKVQCYNHQDQRVPNKNCSPNQKPQRKRHCTLPSCTPHSCSDLQQWNNKHEDGNYTIYIKGRQISIYCQGMNTSNPKDYVIVGEDNFSEIFTSNSRWSRTEQCFQDAVLPGCDCARSDYGLTVFKRIALNTSTLQVITDDFTYSYNYHGRHVAFGSAGDCYRITNCPQGKFSINLVGTGFFVSPHTKWTRSGYGTTTVQRTEDGQVVRGKCGGNCGTCTPHSDHGLLLEVALP